MTTQVFSSYKAFCEREDKTINGVSDSFSERNINWEKMNSTNVGCYDCNDCNDCNDCDNCNNCDNCYNCYKCNKCNKCNNCDNCDNCDNCYTRYKETGKKV